MDGTENRDINARAVLKAGAGIVLATVGAALLMWFLFNRFAAREAARSPQPARMAASDPRKEPPEPRLQPAPVMDLKSFLAGEEVLLKSYAWVDPQKGVVRIPVERAMELVAKEGLPSRREGAKQ